MSTLTTFKHGPQDGPVKTFVLGVLDGAEQGELSVGRDYEANFDLQETYHRGVNVGEWLWDLTHLKNVARRPWRMRGIDLHSTPL